VADLLHATPVSGLTVPNANGWRQTATEILRQVNGTYVTNHSELYTPTIARMMPMEVKRWNGFSVTNALPKDAKLTYVRLNSQTPSAFAKATARQVPTNTSKTSKAAWLAIA
jgi:hypothetical protein